MTIKRDFDEAFAEHCEIMNRRLKERPCPGCGNRYKMPSQKLCDECKRELHIGHARVIELEDIHESEHKSLVMVGTEFMIGLPSSSWPRRTLHFQKDRNDPDYEPDYHDFIKALASLVSVGEPSELQLDIFRRSGFKTEHYLYINRNDLYFSSTTKERFWMRRDQVSNLKLVLDFVHQHFRDIYRLAFERGRSLLRELASGGIEELNRVTLDRHS